MYALFDAWMRTCSLTGSTRADELQENEIAEEKGKGFRKTSLYMELGKVCPCVASLLSILHHEVCIVFNQLALDT